MGNYNPERDYDTEVRGPSLPSFTTAAYYQALSQDERQYGEEAEYRQQFYNFVEQLHQQVYDAVVKGDEIISRGDLYQAYPDNPQLQAQVNEYFDTLFPFNGSAIVANILSSDLFSDAVTEYNRASGNFDFAAGWDSLSSPEGLQEAATEQRQETTSVYGDALFNELELDDSLKEQFDEWFDGYINEGQTELPPELFEAMYDDKGPKILEALGELGSINEFDPETYQKENLWETQILPALEAGGEFIQTAIFGTTPSGAPKTFDEMFEEWMQSQMDQLKGPLTVTFDPKEGLLAEIKIPIGFEVGGAGIDLPIFDADGNFVLPQTIEDVFVSVNPQGQNIIEATIDGVKQQIGEIFTGPDGTVVTRIIDAAGNVVSELGLGAIDIEDGSATGVLTGAVLSGNIFYNNDSGTFEEADEVTTDELLAGDSDLNGTDELDTSGEQTTTEEGTVEDDPDDDVGFTENEEEEEDTTEPVDAEDIETEAYSGMFDNVPEDDRVAYLSDVEAAKEEVLDTLGTQLSDLGVEVNDIDRILGDVQQQLEGVATAEDLDTLRTSLEGTISDELSALGIEDIQSTLTAVETDIDDLDTAISDLTTTVSELNNLSTEDVEGIVSEALEDLENISEEDVTNIVSDIVDDLNNLGTEDVEGIVETALGSLEDLSEDEVENIVNNIVGSPSTDEVESTGLYGAIEDVSTQVSTLDTDLNSRIDDLVEAGVERADAVDQALSELADANNTTAETILEQIGTTEAALLEQIGTTEEALTGQISELDTDLNNRIDALVEAGVERADAVDQALSDLAIANQTSEEAILAQIGTTEAALTGQITELGEDITGVGADVEALAQTVGQDTQYDEAGNVVSEATGVFAEFDNLVEQGANEYQALTTAISNVSDQVGTTETTLFGAIADSENRLSDIIGSPSMSDDPNTPEDESVLATGIYADIEQSASDVSSAVGSAIGGMGGGFEDFMGGIDYNLPQYVGVEYKPRKDYMIELDRLIQEGFESRQDIRQDSMFGDLIA